MYMCAGNIHFASVLTTFRVDFRPVLTVWHFFGGGEGGGFIVLLRLLEECFTRMKKNNCN
jgi:hypothetical protein